MGPACQVDRNVAGWLQALSQQPAESGYLRLAHGREGLTGARSPEDGLPEVVEVGVSALRRDHSGVDGEQAGGDPEGSLRLKPGGAGTWRHGNGPADSAQGFIHGLIREAPVLHIPGGGRHGSTGGHDPRHFGDTLRRSA